MGSFNRPYHVRDYQRQRVYNSEYDYWEWSWISEKMTLDQSQRFVDDILKSQWWKGRTRIREIECFINPRRKVVRAWAHKDKDTGARSIELRPNYMIDHILIHELCHHLTDSRYRKPIADHGPEFAGNLVAMVSHYFSRPMGSNLSRSMEKFKVDCAPPVKRRLLLPK